MLAVYSPASSAEAHMLAHLLEQAGISAHIHGEALQGGVGELPAAGLLQLLVADEDYDAARKLILDWERVQPAPKRAAPKAKTPWVPVLVALTIGVVVGWVLKDRAVAIPIDASVVPFDDNNDGFDDGKYYYRVGASFAHKIEEDNNFDDRVDAKTYLDANGALSRQESDLDFDGFFETRNVYADGNLQRSGTDLNQNNVDDIVSHFRLGLLRRVEISDLSSAQLVRIDYYNNFLLTNSDHDLDGDGALETRRTYDRNGEIASTERLAR